MPSTYPFLENHRGRVDGKTSEVAALLSEALGGLHGVQIEAVDAGVQRDVQIDFLAGFTDRSRRFFPLVDHHLHGARARRTDREAHCRRAGQRGGIA